MTSQLEITVPARMNIADSCLDQNIRAGRGDKIALIADGHAYTYKQMTEMVARVASALRKLGLHPEQRVLMVVSDSAEFVASFFGVTRMGAVPVPVNTMLAPGDYAHFLEDSRARLLIVDSNLLSQVPLESPWLEYVVVVGGDGGHKRPSAGGPQFVPFESLLAEGDSTFPPLMLRGDDTAFWLYTSGSTGVPKGAVHLHQDVLYTLFYGRGVLGVDESSRLFSSSKLFFSYALGCCLFIPFQLGGMSILYSGRSTSTDIARVAAEQKPTIFFSVPTFFATSLRANVAADAYDSVDFCVSAGEPLPPALYHEWLRHTGKEIVEHIGSTEFIGAFISNRPGQVKPGASGQLVPNFEARIVDASLQEVKPGQVGELLVKGGSSCFGYWGRREQTRRTFLGDWIRTGDMYRRDRDGYFWNLGRADDTFKAGGIWVSPSEIEQTLLEHPAVVEAGVVGVPDREGLIKPKAFVVVQTPVSVEELQAHVKERIAHYKCPRWIEFVNELPRTATGKLQRFRLKELPTARTTSGQ